MARKAKKKVHPMPKLGWQDMLLYWALMIVTGVGAFVVMLIPTFFQEVFVDSNPKTLATSPGEGYLNNFWLGFWLLITCFIIGLEPYKKRTPIFGRKDIKYGPPAYPRVFPLLMKNKPQYWQSDRIKAKTRKVRCIVICSFVVTFLFSAALLPQSLYGRYELRTDGTVVVFDQHNKESEHYYLHEIESVSLYTYYSGGKSGSHEWEIGFKMRFTDNDDCVFSAYTLKEDRADSFRELQRLKDTYKPVISIAGQDNLWKVVRDNNLTAEESKLLYELFEIQQP